MTARQAYEYALIEVNKRKAPSLLLEDFNYLFIKAVNQFINRMYNSYEINQQKTDDLRVLKATAVLIPELNSTNTNTFSSHEVYLPDDYLHILNCIVEYVSVKNNKCLSNATTWQQGAKRMTADMASQVLNNYYLKPSYKNPYFYINNVNVINIYPTSDNQVPILETEPRIPINRYGNKTRVRMEIKYGKDNSLYTINKVYIDYLKTPQHIELTQEQVDDFEDNSQILEFPDYICQEIVNDLVKLMLENTSDPRLQSHIPINQSITSLGQDQQKR